MLCFGLELYTNQKYSILDGDFLVTFFQIDFLNLYKRNFEDQSSQFGYFGYLVVQGIALNVNK